MLLPQDQTVVHFCVRATTPGLYGVFETGFEKAITEFSDMETAEQYALQLAGTKHNWKVDVFDETGQLAGTYNSEDDSMPKPVVP